MLQPDRSYSLGSYRYGFNGKENDNEVKGEGNQQDYGFRIYDPRIGRFLSVDPITAKYPMLTPYQFSSNRPIDGIDLDGLEHVPYFSYFPNSGGRTGWDYINAANNAGVDVLNIVPTLIDGSINTVQFLREGTYIQHLREDAKIIGSQLKSTGISLWNNPVETVTSPEALRLGLSIYIAAKVPLPGGGNKGNLLKPTIVTEVSTTDGALVPKYALKGFSFGKSFSQLVKHVSEFKLVHLEETILKSNGYKSIHALSDADLIESVLKPNDGEMVQVNTKTGNVVNGNTRIYELQQRGLDIKVPYEEYRPDDSMFPELKEPPKKD